MRTKNCFKLTDDVVARAERVDDELIAVGLEAGDGDLRSVRRAGIRRA